MSANTPNRIEFLTDVMTIAAEGGINYWAQVTEYKWSCADPTARVLAVVDVEDEKKPYRVDLEAIDNAIVKIFQSAQTAQPSLGMALTYRQQIVAASQANDAGDIDADLADMIVQVACFGEALYS